MPRLRTPRVSTGAGPVRRLGSAGRGGSPGGLPQTMSFDTDSPQYYQQNHARRDDRAVGHSSSAAAMNSSTRSVDITEDFGAMDSPVHAVVNKVVFAVDISEEPGQVSRQTSAVETRKTALDDLDEDYMNAILEEEA